jgi:hypothetical protein
VVRIYAPINKNMKVAEKEEVVERVNCRIVNPQLTVLG